MKSFDWASIVKPCENENSRTKIKIEGLLRSEAFQRARLCARKLHGHLPDRFAKPEINEMLQVAWHDKIEEIRRCLGGKAWRIRRPVVVFIDNELIGDDVAFIRHMGETYAFHLPICSAYYENLIAREYQRFIQKFKRKYVYFTFTVEDSVIGSFLIMLYTDLVPRTCEHFSRLCTGYESKNAWETRLSYKNTKIHRIVENGWIQIGDIFESKEDIDESALNEITMKDESYCVPHDRRGVVSMANDGRQNNRDQFVVSLRPNQWMDRRYVAFGQLIEGANTLKKIEKTATYYEAPTREILISDCGEYSFGSEIAAKVETEEVENDENSETMENRFADSIDDRDVASLMMFERYEEGLYSLSTDRLPSDLQRERE